MVQAIRSISGQEDSYLLAGHAALLLGDTETAQDMLLKSSNQLEALHMHRDLYNWEQALALANRLAPEEMPYISREYANQKELSGDFAAALPLYEKGLTEKEEDSEHNNLCRAGIARCSIRTGDFKRGIAEAEAIAQRQLYRDCAVALEAMGQHNDAARFYEKGEQFNSAAQVYIKAKNWPKVGELLSHITSPKLQSQYAKARRVVFYCYLYLIGRHLWAAPSEDSALLESRRRVPREPLGCVPWPPHHVLLLPAEKWRKITRRQPGPTSLRRTLRAPSV